MRVAMTDNPQRQQRAKNLALLAVLGALVLLFYVMALVKMGAF